LQREGPELVVPRFRLLDHPHLAEGDEIGMKLRCGHARLFGEIAQFQRSRCPSESAEHDAARVDRLNAARAVLLFRRRHGC
jgi:hypothetical protein